MIKITDVVTQNDVNYVIALGDFGLNLKTLDSFLLLRRLGVTDQDVEAGVKDVNFRPAPGVIVGWVYTSKTNAVLRTLAPGFGYVVSFTDWNDPAFDPAAGQFAKGTDASTIEIATGLVLTLFDSTVQVSYGWNLNVKQDRRYLAIGFSFIRLSDKLASLIKQ